MLLAFTSFGFASITELSQGYVPAGQSYSITALENLTPLTLGDGTSTGANPNMNVSPTDPGGYGVRHNGGSDDGICLYNSIANCGPGNHILTTGLNITFNHLVSSYCLSATLGDLVVGGNGTSIAPTDVAPTVSIYGIGGSLLGNFSTATILADHALTSVSSPTCSNLWNLNLSALVGTTAQISGFTLGADTHNGVGSMMNVNNDSYFLNSVNCAPVPEPGSAFLILSAGIGALIITRRRNRNLFCAK